MFLALVLCCAPRYDGGLMREKSDPVFMNIKKSTGFGFSCSSAEACFCVAAQSPVTEDMLAWQDCDLTALRELIIK